MIFGLVITRKNADAALRDGGHRIRCPKCEWEPSKHDRWHCDDACGHVWNTFETAGPCPAWQKQWRETACLRCGIWSPHDEWYVATE